MKKSEYVGVIVFRMLLVMQVFFAGMCFANQVFVATDLDPKIQEAFGGTHPDPSPDGPAFIYPEADTVVPSGLIPIVIQWEPKGNRFFKLVLTYGSDQAITIFTDSTSYPITQEQWTTLSEFADSPIRMSLVGKASLEPGTADLGSEPRAFTIAKADFPGIIYYREIQTFRINRIDPGATKPEALFKLEIGEPQCHGCHSVNRDGTQLAYSLWNNYDPRSGLVYLENPNPINIREKSLVHWSFTTFHPDGKLLVAVTDGQLWLGEVAPNQPAGVIKISDIPGTSSEKYGTMAPKWSPDGKHLAYVTRPPHQKDWGFDKGNLMVIDFDPDTRAFSQPRLLHAHGRGPFDRNLSFPDWSPDGKWVAVDKSVSMQRFRNGSSLWMVDTKTLETIHLERGAPHGHCGYPRFYPSAEGSYYWLLFHSKRPYGKISDKKQLWAMAIDVNIKPDQDPSHPAFWIPGQSLDYDNIQGVVAPRNNESESLHAEN